jgi:von Willebrand factor type A domain
VAFSRAVWCVCLVLVLTIGVGSSAAAAASQPADFALSVKPAKAGSHDPGIPYLLRVRNIRTWTATSIYACARVQPKQVKVVGVTHGGAVRFGGKSACWIVRRIKPHRSVSLRFDIRAKGAARGKPLQIHAGAAGGNSYAAGHGFKVTVTSPPQKKKKKAKKHHGASQRANPVAAASATCITAQTLGVVFVTDDSESMENSDPFYLRSQAISVGLDQLPDGSLAAATAFSSYSSELFGVTAISSSTRPDLKRAAENLYDEGTTEYGEAFAGAREELAKMSGADHKAVVFLSDGAPTDGFDESTPVDVEGVPVYTIGLGAEGSEAASILSHIAAGSGGQFYEAQSASQLQGIFGQILATLTCNAQVVAETFTLSPGASRTIPFSVAFDDGEFRALAAWSSESVAVAAQRPDGTTMTPGTLNPGENFVNERTYALLTGANPLIGDWNLVLTANQGNLSDVSVTINVFKKGLTQPGPPPPAAGRYLDPCITAYPNTRRHSKKIFGGHEEIYDRAASLYNVCAGFGAPEDLSYSPEMKCALVAAAATFAPPPTSIYADQACDAIGIAEAYRTGNWLGYAGGKACGFFSEVFAGGVGVFAAGATAETGPGAVAIGTYTYRALAAGLKVACGGLFAGGAATFGAQRETDHETHIALDVTRKGKCIAYRERFSVVDWRAIDCT